MQMWRGTQAMSAGASYSPTRTRSRGFRRPSADNGMMRRGARWRMMEEIGKEEVVENT
jgi:hypothetical protein